MLLSREDIINNHALPQVNDYTIYPWLIPGRLCLIIGPTNSGKSTLTLELIATLLTGEHLWNRYPTKKISKVLYFHAEHTLATLQEAAKIRGDIPADVVSVIHDYGTVGTQLVQNGTLNHTLAKAIIEAASDIKPELIIVEPISAFLGSSENDNLEVRKVVNFFANLAAKFNASLISHHHVGKSHFDPERSRPEGIASGEARGAMAFEDAAECVIYLKRTGKKEENHLRIETPKAKGFPISPCTLSFDEDTLSYNHVPLPLQERDLIAIYERIRKYPTEKATDLINYFKSLWKCTPNKVSLMIKRATKVGLIKHPSE